MRYVVNVYVEAADMAEAVAMKNVIDARLLPYPVEVDDNGPYEAPE